VSAPETDWQARLDRQIADLLADLPPDEAVYVAAVLVNRAATELHKRVRQEAGQRRGSESWGSWAGLQNTARALVLQSSSARDAAAGLTNRKR
jgi:hypothetical protein